MKKGYFIGKHNYMVRTRVIMVDLFAHLGDVPREWFARRSEVTLCGIYTSLEDTLHALRLRSPDILLVVQPGGKEQVHQLMGQIKWMRPNLPQLVYLLSDQDEHIIDTIAAGASGLLYRSETTKEELLECIQGFNARFAPLSPLIADCLSRFFQKPIPPDRYTILALTAIEKELLTFFAMGKSVAEISEIMMISENWIKKEIGQLYEKIRFRKTA